MSNEKFKVKFGLAVGDTSATIDATTGDIVTDGSVTIADNLVLKGATSGAVIIHSPAVAGTQDYTLPAALPAVTGYVLSSTTAGVQSWVDNPDTNTTYTIDASSTTGGANFNLVGSDASTDTIKIASGTGITVAQTDANTITVTNTAPDTNTTYTQNISSTTGGANLNLVGSDATTDTVKFANGTGVTVAYTDPSTATIAIGQDVAITANPTFAGATMGNVTVGVATDNTISTTTGDLTITSATAATGVTGTLTATGNITGLSTKGTNTISVGETPDASGNITAFISPSNGIVPGIAAMSNAAGGRQSYITVTEYGQNRVGGTAASGGRPLIHLQGSRGTNLVPTATGNGDVVASYQAGGYDGAKWVLKDRVSAVGAQAFNAAAAWTNETAGTGTGSIAGTVMTIASGSGFYPGALISGTGIATGTYIVTVNSTSTKGGAGSYTVSQSQTVASTTITTSRQVEAGTAYSLQVHPLNMGLNEYTVGSSSRQFIQYTSWNTASTSAPATLNYNFGDGTPVSTDCIYVGAGSYNNRLFYGHARSDVTFINSNLQVSGVTGNDTAVFTGSVSGSTLTVTAMTSGTISVGQVISSLIMPDLTRITALGTGTGGTGTYTVSSPVATGGITVGSTTITATPDNSTLLGTNNLKFITGRKSGISGRKMPVKNQDFLGGVIVQGTNAINGGITFSTNAAGSFGWIATEDYSVSAGGSQFSISTTPAGTVTPTSRVFLNSATGAIQVDALQIKNSTGATTYATFNATNLTLNTPLQMNGATSGFVALQSPAVAGAQTYTLPSAVPATNGQILTSTTAGVLSWSASVPASTVTWANVTNQPHLEVYDLSASIPLSTTPILLQPATTLAGSSGITYSAATGVFTFTAEGSYNVSIVLNAISNVANKHLYFYAERWNGSAWVVISNSGKYLELLNNQVTQIVNAQNIYRQAGEQIRYWIYSDNTSVELQTLTLPGIASTVYVPAIRIQTTS